MSHARLLHGPLRPLERDELRAGVTQAALTVLGAVLVRDLGTTMVHARIVEVEAYDEHDPASHSACGRTPRNEAMFEDAGTAYLYRSYGVHWCVNVAAGPEGRGAAVLLRAAATIDGIEEVRRRRPRAETDAALLRGPGCLTAGLDIDGPRHGGLDLLGSGGPVWLANDGWLPSSDAIETGPRIGVSRASELAWRWFLRGDPAVSRYRRSPRAAPPDL